MSITTHWCLWVWISIRVKCIPLCDKVCQWLATGRWFSPGPSVSSTNKTDRHNITEIFLKVALNTIKQTNINDSDWNNCVLLVLCEFGCDICNIKLSKLLISFHFIFIKKIQREHALYNGSLNLKLAYLIHFLLGCHCSIWQHQLCRIEGIKKSWFVLHGKIEWHIFCHVRKRKISQIRPWTENIKSGICPCLEK